MLLYVEADTIKAKCMQELTSFVIYNAGQDISHLMIIALVS